MKPNNFGQTQRANNLKFSPFVTRWSCWWNKSFSYSSVIENRFDSWLLEFCRGLLDLNLIWLFRLFATGNLIQLKMLQRFCVVKWFVSFSESPKTWDNQSHDWEQSMACRSNNFNLPIGHLRLFMTIRLRSKSAYAQMRIDCVISFSEWVWTVGKNG